MYNNNIYWNVVYLIKYFINTFSVKLNCFILNAK